jgi:hypothetical protein
MFDVSSGLDTTALPPYRVVVGRRISLIAGLGEAAAAILLLTASSAAAQDQSVLVYDFGNEDSVIEEHTAQMLWNLNTDNLDLARFPTMEGWNSNHLTVADTVTGAVEVDLASLTISGTLTESWQCSGGCVDEEGIPYFPTTMDTGFTVTIQDGYLVPDGPMWKVDAVASIAYNAEVTSNESPSDCGGEPCYTCLDRVCKINETMRETADLEGWLDGDTLSLAFTDRLEADISQMEFADIRHTQFFMSRFSITITGAVATPANEPIQGVGADTSMTSTTTRTMTSVDDSGDVDQAKSPTPAIAAGDPANDQSNDTATQSPAAPAAEEDPDKLALEAILILILLGFGSAAWVVLKRPKWFAVPRRPSPPAPPVAEGSVSASLEVLTEVEAPEPAVVHTLVGSEKWDYRYTEITYPSGTVTLYEAGGPVKVLGRAYDAVKIQVGSDKPVWVDRSYIEMKRARPTHQ